MYWSIVVLKIKNREYKNSWKIVVVVFSRESSPLQFWALIYTCISILYCGYNYIMFICLRTEIKDMPFPWLLPTGLHIQIDFSPMSESWLHSAASFVYSSGRLYESGLE
jgi:hypothetical protein